MRNTETNLCFLTISEAAEMLRRQELSPVELTQAFLQRIEATDGELHSFITVLKDQAQADARTARRRFFVESTRVPSMGFPSP